MGQGNSTTADPPSPEELALRLTNIFTDKCFSHFELRCFKHTFKSLAEDQAGGVRYWPEATFLKFLELPDTLGSGPALYNLCTYLGAFPFPSHAPAVLTADALLRIVCLMTGKYKTVLQNGKETWRREIWRACAVFDQEASKKNGAEETNGRATHANGGQGASKTANKKQEESQNDEDELAYRAFELLDALEVYEQSKMAIVQHGSIPRESFLKLLQLLLLIAPLGPAENVSLYTTQLSEKRLEGLRAASKCILASFGVEENSGIGYEKFDAVITNTLPHLFDSFGPLFEHFLFPKDFNVHKSKASAPENGAASSSEAPSATVASQVEPPQIPAPEPLLPVQGDILDLNLLSQLSFVFSDKNIFHRLRPLYLGHNHGYSMGSFEKSVFKWQAPSILLVSGTLLSPNTKQSHARTFLEEIPHRRLSSSVSSLPPLDESASSSAAAPTEDSQRIIYGAYIPVPWKATHKTTFGTEQTTLFQLSPVHDVFPASSANQNYTYFNKPNSMYSGLGFGSPLPTFSAMTASQQSSGGRRPSVTSYSASDTAYGSGSFSENSSFSGPSSPGITRRSSLVGDELVPLGPVSLHIDDALEFGVFTHMTSTAGSFQPSKLPATARSGNGADWQDRFEIDAIEVWGVGDASVAEEQRRAWLWEAREAERSKTVNLTTGDAEADKELLKLAGLIKDEGRSGGSV